MFVQNSSLVTYIENVIVDYIDLDFTLWLTWLLTPLLITFLLPLIIVLLLYVTALTFYIYKLHRHRLRHAYDTDFWDGARKTASAVWDAHGWIWHGLSHSSPCYMVQVMRCVAWKTFQMTPQH